MGLECQSVHRSRVYALQCSQLLLVLVHQIRKPGRWREEGRGGRGDGWEGADYKIDYDGRVDGGRGWMVGAKCMASLIPRLLLPSKIM